MRRNADASARLLVLLLAFSLLVAQWTGLQHRVAHAHIQSGIAHATAGIAHNDTSDNHLFHSCILLDASAIGAGLPCNEYLPLLLSNAALPIAVLPLVSWQALFLRQFSSRAPPL